MGGESAISALLIYTRSNGGRSIILVLLSHTKSNRGRVFNIDVPILYTEQWGLGSVIYFSLDGYTRSSGSIECTC
jgi:type 1 glutamine amidotransferase